LSSGSAAVAARIPASLRSLGGVVQERGWRLLSFLAALSANSRRWRTRCWARGRRWAVLFGSVDYVDWLRQYGDLDKHGVFPGRRSPELATASFAASPNRGPQSSLSARMLLQVLAQWKLVFVSGVVFSGGGPASRVLVLYAEIPWGLFVFSCWLGVFCVKYRGVLALLERSGWCVCCTVSTWLE
jgi:hypothetical protein